MHIMEYKVHLYFDLIWLHALKLFYAYNTNTAGTYVSSYMHKCQTIDFLVLLRFDRLQLTFYGSYKGQTWYADIYQVSYNSVAVCHSSSLNIFDR